MASTKPILPPTSLLLHRLTLPKFLLKEAHRCIERPGHYSLGLATSILQDAAESFLRTVAFELGVNVHAQQSFNEVLGQVSKDVSSVAEYRAVLSHLNNARVMFKHQGLSTLNKNDVVAFAVNVESFLVNICRSELNLEFAGVSLANAIGHLRTQNWITKAEEALEAGDLESSLKFASGAMAIYLAHSNDHDPVLKDPCPLSPFSESHFHSSWSTFSEGHDDQEWKSWIIDFAEWTQERIGNIHDRVRLMSRNVDVSSFDKFQLITPTASLMANGSIHFKYRPHRPRPSRDEARFCIDVVIDAALALRTNRPSARAQPPDSLDEVNVVRQVDMLVYPRAPNPEVIRSVGPGETPLSPKHHQPFRGNDYLAVLQDGDIGFVSQDSVEVVQPGPDADMSSGKR